MFNCSIAELKRNRGGTPPTPPHSCPPVNAGALKCLQLLSHKTHERIIFVNFVGTPVRSFFIVSRSHAILGQSVLNLLSVRDWLPVSPERRRRETRGSTGTRMRCGMLRGQEGGAGAALGVR